MGSVDDSFLANCFIDCLVHAIGYEEITNFSFRIFSSRPSLENKVSENVNSKSGLLFSK